MADYTNKPISPNGVPEDILKKVVREQVKSCKNTISMEEIEALAFGETSTIKNTVKSFFSKLFHACRAIVKKFGDYLNNEDFLTGVQVGIHFMLVCMSISSAVKAAKDKKRNA